DDGRRGGPAQDRGELELRRGGVRRLGETLRVDERGLDRVRARGGRRVTERRDATAVGGGRAAAGVGARDDGERHDHAGQGRRAVALGHRRGRRDLGWDDDKRGRAEGDVVDDRLVQGRGRASQEGPVAAVRGGDGV